jgi:DNA polymerase III alpha subunit (gram-positive type)
MDDLISSPLSDSPYVVVHCETTGLDPEADTVYDVALVRFEHGEPTQRFCSFVYPQRAIPVAVLRSCSISNLDVADAPTLEEMMPQLRAFAGDDSIVVHDAEIAQAFLGEISESKRWLSVIELAPRTLYFGLSRDFSARGLVNVADLDEHPAMLDLALCRAEGEAVMTGLVMHEMLEEFEGDGYTDLDQLYPLAGRRRPETWLSCRPYHDRIANLPEHVLRWVLRDACKSPRMRCLHPSKDALYAIKVHLEAYRNTRPTAARRVSKLPAKCG